MRPRRRNRLRTDFGTDRLESRVMLASPNVELNNPSANKSNSAVPDSSPSPKTEAGTSTVELSDVSNADLDVTTLDDSQSVSAVLDESKSSSADAPVADSAKQPSDNSDEKAEQESAKEAAAAEKAQLEHDEKAQKAQAKVKEEEAKEAEKREKERIEQAKQALSDQKKVDVDAAKQAEKDGKELLEVEKKVLEEQKKAGEIEKDAEKAEKERLELAKKALSEEKKAAEEAAKQAEKDGKALLEQEKKALEEQKKAGNLAATNRDDQNADVVQDAEVEMITQPVSAAPNENDAIATRSMSQAASESMQENPRISTNVSTSDKSANDSQENLESSPSVTEVSIEQDFQREDTVVKLDEQEPASLMDISSNEPLSSADTGVGNLDTGGVLQENEVAAESPASGDSRDVNLGSPNPSNAIRAAEVPIAASDDPTNVAPDSEATQLSPADVPLVSTRNLTESADEVRSESESVSASTVGAPQMNLEEIGAAGEIVGPGSGGSDESNSANPAVGNRTLASRDSLLTSLESRADDGLAESPTVVAKEEATRPRNAAAATTPVGEPTIPVSASVTLADESRDSGNTSPGGSPQAARRTGNAQTLGREAARRTSSPDQVPTRSTQTPMSVSQSERTSLGNPVSFRDVPSTTSRADTEVAQNSRVTQDRLSSTSNGPSVSDASARNQRNPEVSGFPERSVRDLSRGSSQATQSRAFGEDDQARVAEPQRNDALDPMLQSSTVSSGRAATGGVSPQSAASGGKRRVPSRSDVTSRPPASSVRSQSGLSASSPTSLGDPGDSRASSSVPERNVTSEELAAGANEQTSGSQPSESTARSSSRPNNEPASAIDLEIQAFEPAWSSAEQDTAALRSTSQNGKSQSTSSVDDVSRPLESSSGGNQSLNQSTQVAPSLGGHSVAKEQSRQTKNQSQADELTASTLSSSRHGSTRSDGSLAAQETSKPSGIAQSVDSFVRSGEDASSGTLSASPSAGNRTQSRPAGRSAIASSGRRMVESSGTRRRVTPESIVPRATSLGDPAADPVKGPSSESELGGDEIDSQAIAPDLLKESLDGATYGEDRDLAFEWTPTETPQVDSSYGGTMDAQGLAGNRGQLANERDFEERGAMVELEGEAAISSDYEIKSLSESRLVAEQSQASLNELPAISVLDSDDAAGRGEPASEETNSKAGSPSNREADAASRSSQDVRNLQRSVEPPIDNPGTSFDSNRLNANEASDFDRIPDATESKVGTPGIVNSFDVNEPIPSDTSLAQEIAQSSAPPELSPVSKFERVAVPDTSNDAGAGRGSIADTAPSVVINSKRTGGNRDGGGNAFGLAKNNPGPTPSGNAFGLANGNGPKNKTIGANKANKADKADKVRRRGDSIEFVSAGELTSLTTKFESVERSATDREAESDPQQVLASSPRKALSPTRNHVEDYDSLVIGPTEDQVFVSNVDLETKPAGSSPVPIETSVDEIDSEVQRIVERTRETDARSSSVFDSGNLPSKETVSPINEVAAATKSTADIQDAVPIISAADSPTTEYSATDSSQSDLVLAVPDASISGRQEMIGDASERDQRSRFDETPVNRQKDIDLMTAGENELADVDDTGTEWSLTDTSETKPGRTHDGEATDIGRAVNSGVERLNRVVTVNRDSGDARRTQGPKIAPYVESNVTKTARSEDVRTRSTPADATKFEVPQVSLVNFSSPAEASYGEFVESLPRSASPSDRGIASLVPSTESSDSRDSNVATDVVRDEGELLVYQSMPIATTTPIPEGTARPRSDVREDFEGDVRIAGDVPTTVARSVADDEDTTTTTTLVAEPAGNRSIRNEVRSDLPPTQDLGNVSLDTRSQVDRVLSPNEVEVASSNVMRNSEAPVDLRVEIVDPQRETVEVRSLTSAKPAQDSAAPVASQRQSLNQPIVASADSSRVVDSNLPNATTEGSATSINGSVPQDSTVASESVADFSSEQRAIVATSGVNPLPVAAVSRLSLSAVSSTRYWGDRPPTLSVSLRDSSGGAVRQNQTESRPLIEAVTEPSVAAPIPWARLAALFPDTLPDSDVVPGLKSGEVDTSEESGTLTEPREDEAPSDSATQVDTVVNDLGSKKATDVEVKVELTQEQSESMPPRIPDRLPPNENTDIEPSGTEDKPAPAELERPEVVPPAPSIVFRRAFAGLWITALWLPNRIRRRLNEATNTFAEPQDEWFDGH